MKTNVSLPTNLPVQEKKSAYVAKWLISAVKEGKWKVGDRLPPERTIAESLNVSRTAVREALSSLQMVGLVEPRVGDGNYVCGSIEAEIDIDDALGALSESESLVEVWEVRKRVELILAKLAADKANEEDLLDIEGCMEKIKEAVERGDPDEYLVANNDFHLAIAEAGKNTFLKRTLLPLLEITKHQLAKQINVKYISMHVTDLVEKHKDIYTAIKKHDSETAVNLLAQHFAASEDF
ncbi:FadR family transcriptional regulator, partial [Candidatus Bipolaricaulota bacterium]|nr:FadR family transcriptional regulator [Candidatus Bipolaricaulota bacterium]